MFLDRNIFVTFIQRNLKLKRKKRNESNQHQRGKTKDNFRVERLTRNVGDVGIRTKYLTNPSNQTDIRIKDRFIEIFHGK